MSFTASCLLLLLSASAHLCIPKCPSVGTTCPASECQGSPPKVCAPLPQFINASLQSCCEDKPCLTNPGGTTPKDDAWDLDAQRIPEIWHFKDSRLRRKGHTPPLWDSSNRLPPPWLFNTLGRQGGASGVLLSSCFCFWDHPVTLFNSLVCILVLWASLFFLILDRRSHLLTAGAVKRNTCESTHPKAYKGPLGFHILPDRPQILCRSTSPHCSPTPIPARDFRSILDTNLEGLSPSEEVDMETYLQSIPTRERRHHLGWQSIPDLAPWFAKVVFLVN